jgi:hypothetical protein
VLEVLDNQQIALLHLKQAFWVAGVLLGAAQGSKVGCRHRHDRGLGRLHFLSKS